jgi:V8-like Glu-specific endopeptidase
MDPSRARDLYYKYAAAVAYVAVRTPAGDESIGTAFHIGSNIWITARHVVEDNEILDIATTRNSVSEYTATLERTGGSLDSSLFSLHGRYRLKGDQCCI